MVQISTKAYAHSLTALLVASLVGCGSSGSAILSSDTTGPSGKVIQAPVSGASVWADDLTAGTRFSIDTAEQATQTSTGGGGNFTLRTTPSYKYVIMSQGGNDTTTSKKATTMLGPGGAKSTSPLTTLVMLDTTGTMAATLSSILPGGASFDTDFTVPNGLNPSSLMFITSITTMVTTFNEAIQDAATRSNATLSTVQQNVISMTLYSALAAQLSSLSAAQLSNTSSLSIAMAAAATTAITNINSQNSNLSLPSSIAATIANASVAVAANIVGNATNNQNLKNVTAANVQNAPGVTAPTTGTYTESTVISTNVALLTSTITNTANTASSGITASTTPTNYTPPPITIANNPSITGYNLLAVANGSTYSVKTLTITFSDDMVATSQGGTNYAHSVLNPSNFTFSQSGCSPLSYASKVLTISCGDLNAGTFTITTLKASSTGGVWASSTSLGLLVDNTKSFTLPIITGGTGGNTYNLF